ncbi:MAG: hypothetical protein R3C44_03880 [Chloroflexota bacterium]
MSSPAAFVDLLASAPSTPGVFNPYAGDSVPAARCRTNLEHYLDQMRIQRPNVLLVGERRDIVGAA